MTEETEGTFSGASGFRVGAWRVRPVDCLLVSDDEERRIQPRVMDVLVRLAESAGETVTREQLIADVWHNTIVSDEPLNRCIADLRRNLGDDRGSPEYIITVPRRGYRLIADVSPSASTATSVKPAGTTLSRLRWPLLLAGLGVAVVLVALLPFGRDSSPPPATANPEVPVIAVLTTAGREHERGLAVEVADYLARFPELLVQTPDTREDHNDRLHADFLLEIDLADDQRTVTARLVSGQTSRELLARSWNLGDSPSQAIVDLAREIRVALNWRLGPSQQPVTVRPAMKNVAAYFDYLEARGLMELHQFEPSQRAAALLESVVRQEPAFADAHAHLAYVYSLLSLWRDGAPDLLPRAAAAASRATALDERNALAHGATAFVDVLSGQYSSAQVRFNRALDLAPDDTRLRYLYGLMLNITGENRRAVEQYRHALRRDPLKLSYIANTAFAEAMAAEWDAARRTALEARGLGWSGGDTVLYMEAVHRGDEADAIRYFRQRHADTSWTDAEIRAVVSAVLHDTGRDKAIRLVGKHAGETVMFWRTLLFLQLEDRDHVFELMEHGVFGARNVPELLWHPDHPALRRDPRLLPLLEAVGLLGYLKDHGGNDFCDLDDAGALRCIR